MGESAARKYRKSETVGLSLANAQIGMYGPPLCVRSLNSPFLRSHPKMFAVGMI